MSSPDFMRHAGWISPEELASTINIIGVGALGSHVALCAAKMGAMNFVLWDHDSVEAHNLPNQTYSPKHIGMPKVEAMKQVLLDFNPAINVTIHNRLFDPVVDKPNLSGIVCSAVDSMTARKMLIDTVENTDVDLFLEARLGFDFAIMHVINPFSSDDVEYFRSSLCDDKDVAEGPCNLKICTTLVSLVAALVVNQLCSFYNHVYRVRSGVWDYKKKHVIQLTNTLTSITL